ncbi:MAG: hypothetical protein GF387_03435 [Candidatus Portnoybacteria bacterium]|nr:hypothetical protein [Candidatus Portnoybacteria bacterium]
MEQIIQAFKTIGHAFVQEPSIWWFLAPIFILWLGMEIYFGQYKKESLGWNSILANSISFAWINIASFRLIFMEGVEEFTPRILILGIFLIYSLALIFIAFFHKFSTKVGKILAGPTQIYFLSTLSILWGQGVLAITEWIVIDLLIAFIIIKILFKLLRRNLGTLGEVEAVKKGENPL